MGWCGVGEVCVGVGRRVGGGISFTTRTNCLQGGLKQHCAF